GEKTALDLVMKYSGLIQKEFNNKIKEVEDKIKNTHPIGRDQLISSLNSLKNKEKDRFIKDFSKKIETSYLKAALNETCLLGQKNEIIKPTAYDILACLEKYGYSDFQDFCDN